MKLNKTSNFSQSSNTDYVKGDIILMLTNKPVLRFNLYGKNIGTRLKILEPTLLPISLRHLGKLEDKIEILEHINMWLILRHIPLSRKNAKWLLNKLNLTQGSDRLTTLKCRGLTVTDGYWLKIKPEDTWEELNLFDNSFAEVLDEIALNGSLSMRKFTIQGELKTPEYTTDGTYAKCWVRESGGIYLYKTGDGFREVEAEVVSSILADRLNLKHVEYTFAERLNKKCCKCRTISNKEMGIVSYNDVAALYSILNDKPTDSIYEIEKVIEFGNGKPVDMYNMLVFDAIIGNVDRHGRNWGFLQNNQTGVLQGLHPLFDHNCAVNINHNIVTYPSSVLDKYSILELAKYAKRYSNINLTNLKEYYNSKEAKKTFKEIYGSLDELDYLKRNLDLII